MKRASFPHSVLLLDHVFPRHGQRHLPMVTAAGEPHGRSRKTREAFLFAFFKVYTLQFFTHVCVVAEHIPHSVSPPFSLLSSLPVPFLSPPPPPPDSLTSAFLSYTHIWFYVTYTKSRNHKREKTCIVCLSEINLPNLSLHYFHFLKMAELSFLFMDLRKKSLEGQGLM